MISSADINECGDVYADQAYCLSYRLFFVTTVLKKVVDKKVIVVT